MQNRFLHIMSELLLNACLCRQYNLAKDHNQWSAIHVEYLWEIVYAPNSNLMPLNLCVCFRRQTKVELSILYFEQGQLCKTFEEHVKLIWNSSKAKEVIQECGAGEWIKFGRELSYKRGIDHRRYAEISLILSILHLNFNHSPAGWFNLLLAKFNE